jgi:hypothetical protein
MQVFCSGHADFSGNIKQLQGEVSLDGRADYYATGAFTMQASRPVDLEIQQNDYKKTFTNIMSFDSECLYNKNKVHIRVNANRKPIVILKGGIVANAKYISSNEHGDLYEIISLMPVIDIVALSEPMM